MQSEIEVKFLGIDSNDLRQKLKSLEAKLVSPQRLMKRKNFDYPDGRLQKVNGWVRVRDEGDKITLSYKQVENQTLGGVKEVCLTVSDFNDICNFLLSIGLTQKSYQETKRESWLLNDVEIEIDTWPWIPPFVELEGRSEKEIRKAAEQLGFNWVDAKYSSVEIAYETYFDVTREEVDNWEKITFIKTPDWLMVKSLKVNADKSL